MPLTVADALIALHPDWAGYKREFAAGEGQVTAQAKGMGARVSKAFTFDNVRRAMTGAGAVAGAVFAGANESFVKLEDQLRTIQTVAPNLNLDKAKDDIQALSVETGKSTEDLANGFYDLVSAGVDAEQAIGVLRDSAKLGVGALGSTAEAVDLVTSAMNAYGLQASDSTRITDIFAKAVADGKVTASEIGTSIANIAPIAASAGIALEEISAGYANLTAKGVPAAQAATQMRSAIVALLTPNAQLNAVQEQTGINFAELMRAKGLSVALEELRKATGGNADAFASALGRVEAYQFALAATGEEFEAFQGQIVETTEATGIANDQFNIKSQSLAEQGKRLAAVFQVQLQNLGELTAGFGPALFALNQFSALTGGAITPARIFGAVVGGLGGRLAAGFARLGRAGGMRIAAALGSSSVVSAMSTSLSGAIGKVGASSKFQGATSKLGSFMGSKLGKGLSIAFAAVAVFEVAETYKQIEAGLNEQSAQIGQDLGNQITSGTTESLQASKAALEQGIEELAGLWYNPFAGGQKAQLEAQLDAVSRELEQRATMTPAAVATKLEEGKSQVDAAAADMVDGIPGAVDKVAEAAWEKAGQIPRGIADGIAARRGAAEQAMTDLVDALKNKMTVAKERARLIGYLTSDELAKGLKSRDPAVRAQAEASREMWLAQLAELPVGAKGLGGKAMNELNRALKSKNPAVRAEARRIKRIIEQQIRDAKTGEAGETAAKNAARGVESGTGAVGRAAWKLGNTIVRSIVGATNAEMSNYLGRDFAGAGASYAVGTSFVPFDMLAQVHKGEIIVPREESDAIRAGQATLGSAPAAAGGRGDTTVNVYNPAPEPASTSIRRELRKLALSGSPA